ncbi:MAG: glycosyltransferase family 39 protein [Thermoanaerobaculia bacterium]|nr:glycosyltransferase family 39 protein [Thermoanaerobaculia bacterium]
MKKRSGKTSKSQTTSSKPARATASSASPVFERAEKWLSEWRLWVLGSLLMLWAIIRVAQFNTVANGPLYGMYAWNESDNAFFDEWARALAAGDWLNRQPLHPYHGWHRDMADYYFQQHPEKLNAILTAHPNRDSTFSAGKILWNEWYGGNTYHQEPLYAYALAFLYWLTGNGVYWMMLLQALLGIGSGYLLWDITRRHFGNTAALLTGLLYLFCGVILFQEALILRSTWSVFFTLLSIWTLDRALDRGTPAAFLGHGAVLGLAFLLQSAFLLFLPGALLLYFWKTRRLSALFARNTGMLLIGFTLVILPLPLRNMAVGAPLLSSSSVGAITFVAANVHNTRTISNWIPDTEQCTEIMGRTGGRFGAAAMAAIQTHPSAGSYLGLVWNKFQRVLNGTEWPNNENYYFYKSLVPALQIAFLDFFWIAWAAAAGMLFALFYRKKYPALYLAMLVQLAILLGFYVLGRFRVPLVALCLPFAAYTLLECLRFAQSGLKAALAKIAVAALCFYWIAWKNHRPDVSMLDPTDYIVLYETVYRDRIQQYADAQQWKEATALHAEFLDTEPAVIRNLKPGIRLNSPALIEIASRFAFHYRLRGDLLTYAGNAPLAAQAKARSAALEQMVQGARQYQGR